MAWMIVKQPNGLLARFSSVLDNFTHLDMSEAEALETCLEYMGRRDAPEAVAAGVNDLDRYNLQPIGDADGLGRWKKAISAVTAVHGQEAADRLTRRLSLAKPIFLQAAEKLGEGYSLPLEFGPAHVVWNDYNFGSAEWCLENFPEAHDNATAEQLAIVKWSLEELVKIPLERRLHEAAMFQGMEEEGESE